MSQTIDSKVVELKFNNKQFESGVAESMSTLDNLKNKVNKATMETGSSLNGLTEAANKVDLSSVNSKLDYLVNALSMKGVIIRKLVTNGVDWVTNKIGSVLTAIPKQMATGGWNRAMNLENAKFQLEGLGYTWDKVGKQISNSVNDTRFALDAAAKAAGSLLATGIEVSGEGDELEKALKSISGVASQTNADYESISAIYRTIAGQGRVMGDQLNQLASRGLNAAATLAKALGTTEAQVREMVSKGQIDFKTFSDAMYDAFADHAFEANNTFEGVTANLKSQLNQIGAFFAEPIIQQSIPAIDALRLKVKEVKGAIADFAGFNLADQADKEAALNELKQKYLEVQKAVEEGTASQEDLDKAYADLEKGAKDAVDAMSPFEKIVTRIRMAVVKLINSVDVSWVNNLVHAGMNFGQALRNIINPIRMALGETITPQNESLLVAMSEGLLHVSEKLAEATKGASQFYGVFKAVFGLCKDLAPVLYVLAGAFAIKSFGTHPILALITAYPVLLKIVSVLPKITKYIKGLSSKSELFGKAVEGIKAGLLVIAALGIKAFEAIGNFFSNNTIGQGMLQIGQNMIAGLTKGLSELKGSKILGTVLGFFSNMVNSIKSLLGIHSPSKVFYQIGKWIVEGLFKGLELVNQLDDNNPMKKVLTKQFEFLTSIFDEDWLVSLKHKLDTIDSVMAKVGETCKNTVSSINDIWLEMDGGRKVALLYTAVMMIFAVKLAKFIGTATKKVEETRSATTSLIKNASDVIKNLNDNGLKGLIEGNPKAAKKKKSFSSAILEIATALGILAVSLKLLTTIPKDEIWGYIGALSALAGIAAALSLVLAISQRIAGKENSLATISMAMLSIAVSIGILAGSLKLLESVTDLDGMLKKVLYLGALAAIMTVIAIQLSKSSPVLFKGVLSILALAFAMKSLAKTLQILSETDITGMSIEKLEYFASLAAVLGVLSFACGKLGIGGFFSLLSALIIIKVASKIMSTITKNADNVKKFVETAKQFLTAANVVLIIVGVLVSMAAAQITKSFLDFSKGMILLAGAISILAIVAWRLGKIDLKSLAKGVGAIVVFMIFTDMLMELSGSTEKAAMIKFATGMLILSTAIGMLSLIAWRLGQLSVKELAKGVIAVDVIGALFGGLMYASQFTEKAKVGAVIAVVVAVLGLMAELIAITILPLPQIATGVIAMSVVMLALSHLFKSINGLNLNFRKASAMLITAGILYEFGYILKDLSKLPWENVAASGVAMGITILAYAKLLKTISSTKGFNKSTIMGKMAAMAVCAAALFPIALSLKLAASQSWTSLLGAGVAMSACLLTVATACAMLSKFKTCDTKDAFHALEIATLLVPIGAMLALVASTNTPWESMISSAASMSICLEAVALACVSLSKFGSCSASDAGTALLMSLSLIPIAAALQLALANNSSKWNEMIGAAGAMAICLEAVALTCVAIGQLGTCNVGDIGKLLIATLTLIPIAAALRIAVGESNWSQLMGAGLAMSVCLISLAGALALVSAVGVNAGAVASLLIMSVGLIAIGEALKLASGVDLTSALGMCAVIATMAVSLALIAVIGQSMIAGILLGAVGMIALAGAMLIMVPAFNAVSGLDWAAIGKFGVVLLELSVALLAIAAVGLFLNAGLLIGAVGIIALAGALTILVPALNAMTTMDWSSVGMFGVVLLELSLALAAIAAVGLFLNAGILIGAIGMIALAGALAILVPVLNAMSGMNWESVKQFGVILLELVVAMSVLSGVATVLGPGMITMSTCMILFATACKTFGQAVILAATGLNLLTPALVIMGSLDLLGIGGSLIVFAAGCAILAVLGPGLMIAAGGMLAVSTAISAMCNAIEGFAKVVNNTLQKALASTPVQMAQSGFNSVTGFINGLTNKGGLSKIKKAGTNIGKNLITAVKTKLDIHSPSKVLKSLGLYSVLGFEEGVNDPDTWSDVFNVVGSKLGGLLDYFKDFIKNIDGLEDIVNNFASNLSSGMNLDESFGLSVDDLMSEKMEIKKLAEESGIASDALDGLGDAMGGAGGSASKAAEKTQKLSDAFKRFDKQTATSTSTLMSNLGTQLKGTIDWAKNMTLALSKGYSGPMKEYIKTLTKDNLGDLQAFANASEAEIMLMNKGIAAKLALDDMDAEKIMKTYEESGAESVEAFFNQLTGSNYDEEVRKMIENAIKPFEKFNKECDVSGKELLDNMQSQIDGIRDWSDQLNMLSQRGISEGLLKYLRDMGPEGYKYVKAFTNMTQEQLAQANSEYSTLMTLDEETAAKLQNSYENAGKWITAGYKNGIDMESARDTMKDFADEGFTAFREYYGIHSPSTLMAWAGANTFLGFIEGCVAKTGEAVKTMTTSAKEIYESAEKRYLNYKSFYNIAKNVVVGLTNGISDYAEGAVSAIAEMAKAMVEKARSIFDEHSPSKVFHQIGAFLTEGAALGVTSKIHEAVKSVDKMGTEMTDAMTEAMTSAYNFLNSDHDFRPVISPVLDLSDIQNGRTSIESLLGSSSLAASMAGSVSANINSSTNSGLTVSSMEQMFNKAFEKYTNQIKESMADVQINSNVDVNLQGDAAGLFRAVRNENNRVIKSTGFNPMNPI